MKKKRLDPWNWQNKNDKFTNKIFFLKIKQLYYDYMGGSLEWSSIAKEIELLHTLECI